MTSYGPGPSGHQGRPAWLSRFEEKNFQHPSEYDWNENDDCITRKLMMDEDIEDCFDGDGDSVCIWPNGGGIPYCCKTLVIKADSIATTYGGDRDFIWDLIRYYVRTCPNVKVIKIVGNPQGGLTPQRGGFNLPGAFNPPEGFNPLIYII